MVGDQLLEVRRVAVDRVVQANDDAVLDGFARAAGVAVEPVELDDIGVLAGGDHQVELVLRLLQRREVGIPGGGGSACFLTGTTHVGGAARPRMSPAWTM